MSDYDDCKCGGWLDGIHSDNCPFKSPATVQPSCVNFAPSSNDRTLPKCAEMQGESLPEPDGQCSADSTRRDTPSDTSNSSVLCAGSTPHNRANEPEQVKPATVQPQPVLERYHIEPSGKMWVEHPPFKEPAPQPAVGAGDSIAKQIIEKFHEAHFFKPEWDCDIEEAINAVLQSQQPCPRCADLEKEASLSRRVKAEQGRHECGCEVCSTISILCPATSSSYALAIIELRERCADLELMLNRRENYYTNCCNEREALTKERDTLQARVSALETALRAVLPYALHVCVEHGWDVKDCKGLEKWINTAVRTEDCTCGLSAAAEQANAALGEKEAG